MTECLTTSDIPATRSETGRVRSVAGSASTRRGWWKAPIVFLPRAWLTAVLPPMLASTWATIVVGTCTKSTPRRKVAATNPARSPDDTAADSGDPAAAVHARFDQPPEDALGSSEVFFRVAPGEEDFGHSKAGAAQTLGKEWNAAVRKGGVGDHRGAVAEAELPAARPDLREDAAADQDLVAAFLQVDGYGRHGGIRSRNR